MPCERCGGQLLANVDEVVCLSCGTMATPVRPWDAVEEPPPVRPRVRAPRSGSPWSRDEVEYLLRNKDRLSAKEIGRRLGRTERGVHTYLSKAGIAKHRRLSPNIVKQRSSPSRRPGGDWTAEELAELEDFARPGAIAALAARLGRSYNAARLRLWRMRVSVKTADGMLSVAEVMGTYGCSRRRVERLIRSEILPAVKAGPVWRIDPVDAERMSRLLKAKSKYRRKGQR